MSLSKHQILPGKTIGIIGGGQLGRMLALAAKEMGYRIAVLDPTPNSPCGQVADIEITAAYNDIKAIQKLAKVSDVITYEFENIDYEALTWLEKHANLPQGSKVLRITQDRAEEKKAITDLGIEVAPYFIVNNEQDLQKGLNFLNTPAVLKTCRGGYDGKGQLVIKSEDDIVHASWLLQRSRCVLEAWIPFEKEISVIVTRNISGQVKTFPVAENIHVNNILHQTIVPARISNSVEQAAQEKAIKLAKEFEIVGTLAVEMFLTEDEKIYVNELAPRPHNSGHFTIDACETSQFQQHIRAVCDWPLGETTLLTPAVMVNILGEHVDSAIENIHAFGNCKLHLYGKEDVKVKRKMGHLTILTKSTVEALEKANSLNIWTK